MEWGLQRDVSKWKHFADIAEFCQKEALGFCERKRHSIYQ